MGRIMKPSTVYFTPDQYRRLKEYTARTDVPWAVLVRKGVETALTAAGFPASVDGPEDGTPY